jgi:hypothetical protein
MTRNLTLQRQVTSLAIPLSRAETDALGKERRQRRVISPSGKETNHIGPIKKVLKHGCDDGVSHTLAAFVRKAFKTRSDLLQRSRVVGTLGPSRSKEIAKRVPGNVPAVDVRFIGILADALLQISDHKVIDVRLIGKGDDPLWLLNQNDESERTDADISTRHPDCQLLCCYRLLCPKNHFDFVSKLIRITNHNARPSISDPFPQTLCRPEYNAARNSSHCSTFHRSCRAT